MFKSLDFIGERVTLFNQGSNRWKTAAGGIVSFIIFLLICGSVVLFGIDIVLKDNPTLGFSTNKEENNFLPIQDLDMVVGIFPGMPTKVEVDPEKHILMKLIHFEVKGVEGLGVKYTLLEKCDNNALFKENKFNILESISSVSKFFYCVPESFKENLFGAKAKNNSGLFSVEVSICTEDHCAPVEETMREFQAFSAQVVTSDYFLDGFDSESPIQHSFFTLPMTSYSNLIVNFEIYLRHIDFFSDEGWIFVRNTETRTFTISDYNLTTAPRGENPNLIRFSVLFDEKKEVMKRRYVKIQEVMAKVGGIVKAVLVLSSLLLNNWTRVSRIQTGLDKMKRILKPKLSTNSSIATVNNVSVGTNNVSAKTKRVLGFSKSWKNWFPLTRHRQILDEYETFHKDILSVETLKALVLDFVSRNEVNLKSWNKVTAVKEASLFTEVKTVETNNYLN